MNLVLSVWRQIVMTKTIKFWGEVKYTLIASAQPVILLDPHTRHIAGSVTHAFTDSITIVR